MAVRIDCPPKRKRNVLVQLRADAGFTQVRVAEILGCTQSQISKLESGREDKITLGEVSYYSRAFCLPIYMQFSPNGEIEISLREVPSANAELETPGGSL